MAAANAVLDVILEKGFLEHVQATADHLWTLLRGLVQKHPKVFTEVRGKGLMIGLKCVGPNGDVVNKAFDNGLLTVVGGDNVVRLLPPLTIGTAEAEAAVAILDRTAAEMAA
jgi:acetylornithine/N-succinyldiaminopimelate aminotransferase